MKSTRHFEEQLAARGIDSEWCRRVVANPMAREIQPNGRIRCWAFIEEKGKWLRVVLLEDGETFHTAMFDRGFERRTR